jgi:hypothetical protein
VAIGAKKLLTTPKAKEEAVAFTHVANFGNRANIVDVSDPDNMTLASQTSTGTQSASTRDIYYLKDTQQILAFIGNTSARFVLYDASDPDNITHEGETAVISELESNQRFIMSSDKSQAWTSGDFSGGASVDRINVSDISNLTVTSGVLASVDFTATYASSSIFDNAWGLALDEARDTILVTSPSDDSLIAVNISNPSSMSLRSELVDTVKLNGARDIHIDFDNQVAFVCCNLGDAITAVDISDYTSMSVLGTLSNATFLNGPYYMKLDLDRSVAFLTCFNGDMLTAVDISDPANMSIYNNFTHADIDNPFAIEYDPVTQYAYVMSTLGDKVVSVDVSDPDNMALGSVLDYVHGTSQFGHYNMCGFVSS